MLAILSRLLKAAFCVHAPLRSLAWLLCILTFVGLSQVHAEDETALDFDNAAAKLELFQTMLPAEVECAILLRPPVSYSNLPEYLDMDGGNIRFIIVVDEDHMPRVIMLRKNELHSGFAAANIKNPNPAGRRRIIDGILTPFFGQNQAVFSYRLHGLQLPKDGSANVITTLLQSAFLFPMAHMPIDEFAEEGGALKPTNAEVYYAGWSVGRLMFVRSAEIWERFSSGDLKTTDILVVDQVPNDIPPVAGLITNTANGKLSHVQLFAGMLDIPFFYLPEIALEPYRRYAGKEIFLQASSRDTDAEVQTVFGARSVVAHWRIIPPIKNRDFSVLQSLRRRPEVQIAVPYTTLATIRSLKALKPDDAVSAGAKAANMGLLIRAIGEDHVPGGAAIPFYYFAQFLAHAKIGTTGLQKFIRVRMTQLMAKDETALTFLETHAILLEIDDAIRKATIPANILSEIITAIKRRIPANSRGYLWRSSSSVEDSEHINGAGLYASAESDGLDEAGVSSALKEVWSSLYSLRAYYARRLFHIDESRVSMAVVVHPKHEEAQIANGVSTLEWGEVSGEFEGLKAVHAAFKGNSVLVTSPLPGRIPEVASLSLGVDGTSLRAEEVHFASTSVFNQGFLSELNRLLAQIREAWIVAYPGTASARHCIDVEWYVIRGGLGEPNRVIIRQVRDMPRGTQITQAQLEAAI